MSQNTDFADIDRTVSVLLLDVCSSTFPFHLSRYVQRAVLFASLSYTTLVMMPRTPKRYFHEQRNCE